MGRHPDSHLFPKGEPFIMRIITKRTLQDFWEGNPRFADAQEPLGAWYDEVRRASWATPTELKAQYRNASVLRGNRVTFNVGGNKYRLVVHVNYRVSVVYVRFIGTHEAYDRIDAETI
jgi:mRNA interferase HigB